MNVHILHTPTVSSTPWWPTDQRHGIPADEKVWTDCCACKVPAGETVTSYVSYYDPPLGGMGGEFIWGGDWENEDWPTGAWYGGDWRVHCADGCGCNVKPSKRCGMALREYMRFG